MLLAALSGGGTFLKQFDDIGVEILRKSSPNFILTSYSNKK